MDPANPNVLYAASYQRRRVPWGFNGGGPGSGIWKTTDGAKTWTKLTGNGLPGNPIIGRIGLDLARSKPSTIYASIEVGASGGTGAGVNDDGTLVDPNAPPQGRGGGGGGGRGNQPPPPPDPNKSGIWRSDDAGKTWKFLSNSMDRPMYYSQIRVDPTNPEIAYQGGAPFFKTVDGGKTWRQVQGLAHSDHHAIWINPRDGKHLMVGNDGGLDITYDQAETWEFVNSLGAVGQFYKVSADMRKPYYVCGGLQDNGSWCGPSGVRSQNGILNSDWFRVGGGDGFYTANDWTDWRILYSESQDGATSRSTSARARTVEHPSARPRPRRATAAAAGRRRASIRRSSRSSGSALARPTATSCRRRLRARQLPLLLEHALHPLAAQPVDDLSRRRADVQVDGPRQHLGDVGGPDEERRPQRSSDHGRRRQGADGVEARRRGGYSNIVTISESPVVPGIVWAGTNDGNVQVSRDGGLTWKNVADKVAGRAEGNARLARRGVAIRRRHRLRDLRRAPHRRPQALRLRDEGFRRHVDVDRREPAEGNVNVITPRTDNRNLLFLGTEYAIYVSMDAGKSWKPLMQGMPTVRIDDLIIHPRDRDLIAGTHGRSIWILDDISPLEQMTDETTAARCGPVRRPAGHRVDQRHPEADHGRRGEELPRPEPGSRDVDQLLAQGRPGKRPYRDHRHHRIVLSVRSTARRLRD